MSYVDPSVQFKSICTTFVVEQFFGYTDSMEKFMQLIIDLHNEAILQYVSERGLHRDDVYFVYKGGNVLRIVANSFNAALPRTASDVLTSFYEPDFKRSDADFTVYVNPSITNKSGKNVFEETCLDMANLSFRVQQDVVSTFLASLPSYFEFFAYTKEHQRAVMLPYLRLMQQASCMHDESNTKYFGKQCVGFSVGNCSTMDDAPDYVGQRDKFVYFGRDGSTVVDELGSRRLIYSSRNTALDFTGSSGRRIRFHLSRSKVAFNLFFVDDAGNLSRSSIGGELIDVSVTLQEVAETFAHLTTTLVPYSFETRNVTMSFWGYSLGYMIHDLEFILFQSVAYPWSDSKYKKRLGRLFYLCFADLYAHDMPNTSRVAFLRRLVAACRTALTSKRPGGEFSSARTLCQRSWAFSEFLNLVTDVFSRPELDLVAASAFIQSLLENSVVCLRCSDQVEKYLTHNGTVPTGGLYSALTLL